MPTPMQIIAACDAGPATMVALGLPQPTTYADVVRTMWDAQDRLSDRGARALQARDRMTLDYAASASKVPGAAPHTRGLPFPTES